MSLSIESAASLRDFRAAPERLVPVNFSEHIENPLITPFEGWIGNLDEGYEADLAFIVSGGFPVTKTEGGDPFFEALIRRHRSLTKRGLVPESTTPAFLFIAHELRPQSSIKGVYVLTEVLHPSLRGRGLGKAFSDNFSQLVWDAGYVFTFGDNRETRFLDKFINNGSIPTDRLDESTIRNLGIPRSPRQTVKFNPGFTDLLRAS